MDGLGGHAVPVDAVRHQRVDLVLDILLGIIRKGLKKVVYYKLNQYVFGTIACSYNMLAQGFSLSYFRYILETLDHGNSIFYLPP